MNLDDATRDTATAEEIHKAERADIATELMQLRDQFDQFEARLAEAVIARETKLDTPLDGADEEEDDDEGGIPPAPEQEGEEEERVDGEPVAAGFDALGNWHDPGNGQFATPGWSTAKALVVNALMKALLPDWVRANPGRIGIARILNPRRAHIDVTPGDRVQIHDLNQQWAVVKPYEAAEETGEQHARAWRVKWEALERADVRPEEMDSDGLPLNPPNTPFQAPEPITKLGKGDTVDDLPVGAVIDVYENPETSRWGEQNARFQGTFTKAPDGSWQNGERSVGDSTFTNPSSLFQAAGISDAELNAALSEGSEFEVAKTRPAIGESVDFYEPSVREALPVGTSVEVDGVAWTKDSKGNWVSESGAIYSEDTAASEMLETMENPPPPAKVVQTPIPDTPDIVPLMPNVMLGEVEDVDYPDPDADPDARMFEAPVMQFRPGDEDVPAPIIAALKSRSDHHVLHIGERKIGEWESEEPPSKQTLYRQINMNGWRVRSTNEDDSFTLVPAAPAQRARTAGLDGEWLVARDNYLSRKGIHQGDVVRVRYRDAETGVVEVYDGDEVVETEIKWDRFDHSPPPQKAARQVTPTAKPNTTRAAQGRGLEAMQRARVAGCAHAKVADNFLNRHGIAAGDVVPVRYIDKEHAAVDSPDGREIHANWARFKDADPAEMLGEFTEPGGVEDLVLGMTFVVYDPTTNTKTPPMVHNANNTYSPLGQPDTQFEWNDALVASMTILTEKETDD